jgi:hypothetical protein
VLAVEMQAASLFAFGIARQANVGVVAHVTNAVDSQNEQFDKGTEEHGSAIAGHAPCGPPVRRSGEFNMNTQEHCELLYASTSDQDLSWTLEQAAVAFDKMMAANVLFQAVLKIS